MLNKIWYQHSWLAWFLYPVSLWYRLVVRLRRYYFLYIKSRYKFPIPIIVVGNITVGGVGKTPLVAFIAQQLCKQGYRPGLVSRGYGGKAAIWPQIVTVDSDPRMVGDEPVLLVTKTQCPMVVGPDRVQAVKVLLEHYSCDVIVSDDGLQHYALVRDMEIAVIDGERRFGNGLCLPAGPLREPVSRLKTVNYRVCNGGAAKAGEYSMRLVAGIIYRIDDPGRVMIPDDLYHKQIHAVCGIGHPQRFFDSLRKMGFEFIEHVFPDHHHFGYADIDIEGDVIVIMTEKDAIKCRAFSDHRHYCLPISVECNVPFLLGLPSNAL